MTPTTEATLLTTYAELRATKRALEHAFRADVRTLSQALDARAYAYEAEIKVLNAQLMALRVQLHTEEVSYAPAE